MNNSVKRSPLHRSQPDSHFQRNSSANRAQRPPLPKKPISEERKSPQQSRHSIFDHVDGQRISAGKIINLVFPVKKRAFSQSNIEAAQQMYRLVVQQKLKANIPIISKKKIKVVSKKKASPVKGQSRLHFADTHNVDLKSLLSKSRSRSSSKKRANSANPKITLDNLVRNSSRSMERSKSRASSTAVFEPVLPATRQALTNAQVIMAPPPFRNYTFVRLYAFEGRYFYYYRHQKANTKIRCLIEIDIKSALVDVAYVDRNLHDLGHIDREDTIPSDELDFLVNMLQFNLRKKNEEQHSAHKDRQEPSPSLRSLTRKSGVSFGPQFDNHRSNDSLRRDTYQTRLSFRSQNSLKSILRRSLSPSSGRSDRSAQTDPKSDKVQGLPLDSRGDQPILQQPTVNQHPSQPSLFQQMYGLPRRDRTDIRRPLSPQYPTHPAQPQPATAQTQPQPQPQFYTAQAPPQFAPGYEYFNQPQPGYTHAHFQATYGQTPPQSQPGYGYNPGYYQPQAGYGYPQQPAYQPQASYGYPQQPPYQPHPGYGYVQFQTTYGYAQPTPAQVPTQVPPQPDSAYANWGAPQHPAPSQPQQYQQPQPTQTQPSSSPASGATLPQNASAQQYSSYKNQYTAYSGGKVPQPPPFDKAKYPGFGQCRCCKQQQKHVALSLDPVTRSKNVLICYDCVCENGA